MRLNEALEPRSDEGADRILRSFWQPRELTRANARVVQLTRHEPEPE